MVRALLVLLLVATVQAQSLDVITHVSAELRGVVAAGGDFVALVEDQVEGRTELPSWHLEAAQVKAWEDHSVEYLDVEGARLQQYTGTQEATLTQVRGGGEATQGVYELAVVAQGATATVDASCLQAARPVESRVEATRRVSNPAREMPAADTSQAVALTYCEAGNLTVRGDFAVVLWHWRVDVDAAQGSHQWLPGRHPHDTSTGLAPTHERRQLYLEVEDGVWTYHVPEGARLVTQSIQSHVQGEVTLHEYVLGNERGDAFRFSGDVELVTRPHGSGLESQALVVAVVRDAAGIAVSGSWAWWLLALPVAVGMGPWRAAHCAARGRARATMWWSLAAWPVQFQSPKALYRLGAASLANDHPRLALAALASAYRRSEGRHRTTVAYRAAIAAAAARDAAAAGTWLVRVWRRDARAALKMQDEAVFLHVARHPAFQAALRDAGLTA